MFHGEEARLRQAFGPGPVRVWRWWWERRYTVADWFYAVCFFPWTVAFNAVPDSGLAGPLVGVLAAVLSKAGLWPIMVFGVLVLPALVSVLIVLRRRRPHWLLATAAVLLIGLGNPVPVAIALYSYAAWFTDRRKLAAWSAVMVAGTAVGFAASNYPVIATVAAWVTFIALPLTAGLWVGTRRQLVENLRERAERLEREQHLLADRAISAERTRIAREMHDVVAHRVSLMVLHAGGLEVSAAEPATSQTAGLIRETGREALAELREIPGVLRDAPNAEAPTAPQPMLADLDRLVADWRATGMDLDWRVTGSRRTLPAQTERTAYRVVQEALTNAAKHAPGGAAAALLEYGADDLAVTVSNDPPPRTAEPPPEPPPSSGYGLTGLRERVALAGGTLSAGPDPDGGWRVRAVLPAGGEETA